jgi:hypothetical protein
LYFVLLEQPDRPQETISFSCPGPCAVADLLEQFQVSSLEQLAGHDRHAYVFEDGEVHLRLLSSKEIWQLIGLAFLFKLSQVVSVGVVVHLLRNEDAPP